MTAAEGARASTPATQRVWPSPPFGARPRAAAAFPRSHTMYGQPGGRPQDFERVARTVHVGGIGGLGETITETDVADFFGQQGAHARAPDVAARNAAASVAPAGAAPCARWLCLCA